MKLIKVIPSALTCANLVCGFLVFLVDIDLGVWLILLGALFDVFDGAVARWLNAQSDLGAQLDSLADMITFGAAPAYLLSYEMDGNWQYVSIIVVITAALRLARFNISGSETYFFKGLAVPASAMFFLGLIIFNQTTLLLEPLPLAIIIIIVALLNVSSIKMFSFKGLKKDSLSMHFIIVASLAFIITLFIDFSAALFVAMLVYILLSIAYHFLQEKYLKVV